MNGRYWEPAFETFAAFARGTQVTKGLPETLSNQTQNVEQLPNFDVNFSGL